jgi:hypothetical protein
MSIASLTMFTIASLDVGLHLRHNLEAFVWYNGPAVEGFTQTSSWINVANTGCHVAQTLIGDSSLVRKDSSTRERSEPLLSDISRLDHLRSQLVCCRSSNFILARNHG